MPTEKKIVTQGCLVSMYQAVRDSEQGDVLTNYM